MRGFPRSVAGAFALVVAVLLVWVVEQIAQQPEEPAGGSSEVTVSIDSVIDGDTTRVWLDGKRESVRYIGIDTPEMNYDGGEPDCFASEASDFNRNLLSRNDQLRLVFDEERRDRYGRLLAYVYTGPTLLQAELLKEGYATTLEIPPNTSRAEQFAKLESVARESGRGGWSRCGSSFGS